MKKPASFTASVLAATAALYSMADFASGYVFGFDTPQIFENYDNNPLGDMIGKTSGGYGVTGNYILQGTTSANAFTVVAGGIPFGNVGGIFNNITANSKCVQVSANATATGAGILVDGGKAWGDTDFNYYNTLYCSYLVQYSISSNATGGGRAEVRTGTTSTGGQQLQLQTDGGPVLADLPTESGISRAQPQIGYSTVYSRAPAKNFLINGIPYLIIGRFEQVGNALSYAATSAAAAWTTAGATTTITLTAANTSITVGQYVTTTTAGLLAPSTVVTSVSGTVITVSPAALTAGSSVPLTFRPAIKPATTSWLTASNSINVDSTTNIAVNMAVVGTGIPADAIITKITGNVLTINKTTTSAGSDGVIITRTGSASLFALTSAQYENFLSRGGGDSVLNDATIGDAVAAEGAPNAQVTVKILAAPTLTGSIEMGQGRYIHLVASGAAPGASPLFPGLQQYKMDELRYGMTLKSVTNPTPYLTGPAKVVRDDFDDLFTFYNDSGYGWKSGYYELEETVAAPGAYGIIYPTLSGEMKPGGGSFLTIVTRDTGSADQGLRRRPDPSVVDMSQPYTLTFDFRVAGGAATFTAFNDRIQIGADSTTAGTGANFGPNPTAATNPLSWLVGVIGGDENAARPVYAQRWYFYDFAGESLAGSNPANYFVKGNMVDTGITLTPGYTYSFKIEVNAPARTYKATIIDSENNVTFSKSGLRFRDNANANTLFWGSSKPANENRVFGLDSIVMTQGVDQYPDWIAAHPSIILPADQLRTADFDKDGVKNYVEYALDGDPTSGASSGKVVNSVSSIDSGVYYTLTLPVRSDVAASSFTNGVSSIGGDGIQYTIEGSYDNLSSFSSANVVVSGTTLSAGMPTLTTSPGWTYKTFRLAQPTSAHTKGFMRAVITTP